MPTIIGGAQQSNSSFLSGYGGLTWMAQRRYDPEQTLRDTKPKMGLSYTHAYDIMARPDKYTAIQPVKALGSPVSNSASRVGNLTMDLTNWFHFSSDATGSALGRDPLVADTGWGPQGPTNMGSSINPLEYLAQRDIGMENFPVRAMDYAVAPIDLMLNGLPGGIAFKAVLTELGILKPNGEQRSTNKVLPFQESQDYWTWLRTSTAEQRRQQAQFIADARADRVRNQPLADMLTEQFNRDFETAEYKSSGNERIDYLAKLNLQASPLSVAISRYTATHDPAFLDPYPGVLEKLENAGVGGLQKWNVAKQEMMAAGDLSQGPGHIAALFIPFVGTGIGRFLNPITPKTEAAWLAQPEATRKAMLEAVGLNTMISDMAVMVPLFSAVGAVAKITGSASAVEAGIAASRYAKYAERLTGLPSPQVLGQFSAGATKTTTRGLQVVNWMMGVGLLNMTASFAMQAAAPIVPAMGEAGEALDASRFVSSSFLAGALNEAGFFAGIYGLGPAFTVVRKVGGGAAMKAGGSHLFGGRPDLRFHSEYGGTSLERVLADGGGPNLTPEFQHTAMSTEFTSMLVNVEREKFVYARRAIDQGQPTGFAWLDEAGMLPENRIRQWEALMARNLDQAVASIDRTIDLVNGKRLGDAKGARQIARRIDDDITNAMLRRYDVFHWDPQVPQLKAAVQRRLAGLKGDAAFKDVEGWSGKDPVKWVQALRKTHQMLFHHRATDMAATAEQAGEDAARFALFSERTLFFHEVDDYVTELAGPDGIKLMERLKTLERGKEQVQEWSRAGAFTTPEGLADLMLRTKGMLPQRRIPADPGMGTQLDTFQRDILEAEGLWTIGMKPVGVFIDEVPPNWIRGADAARMPEAFGATRSMVTPEELMARGYRLFGVSESMAGQEFRARDPVWPIPEYGGGVYIKGRPSDSLPPPTPAAAANTYAQQAQTQLDTDFADPTAYMTYAPDVSDLRPAFVRGTEQPGWVFAIRQHWETEARSSYVVKPGGQPLPDSILNSSVKNVDERPKRSVEEAQADWDAHTLSGEPEETGVEKAGVILYERLEDGSVGIWTLHPVNKATGEPFLGYDLTFPKGGRNVAEASLHTPRQPSLKGVPKSPGEFIASGLGPDWQSSPAFGAWKANKDAHVAAVSDAGRAVVDPATLQYADAMAEQPFRITMRRLPKDPYLATARVTADETGGIVGIKELFGEGLSPQEAADDLIRKMGDHFDLQPGLKPTAASAYGPYQKPKYASTLSFEQLAAGLPKGHASMEHLAEIERVFGRNAAEDSDALDSAIDNLNGWIRKGYGPEGTYTEAELLIRLALVDKLMRPTTAPIKVYRAIGEHGFDAGYASKSAGDRVTDEGFMFASLDESVARAYLHGEPGALIEMELPAGTPVMSNGWELIIGRGQSLTVKSIRPHAELDATTLVRLVPRTGSFFSPNPESLRATAIRELREELGMDAHLQGYAGDFADDAGHGTVRYYIAERRSGGPDFATTPDEIGHAELVDPAMMDARLTKFGVGTTRDQDAFASFATWYGLKAEAMSGEPRIMSGRNYGANWPVLRDRYNRNDWVFKADRGTPIKSLIRAVRLAAPNATKLFKWLGLKTADEIPFEWLGVKGTIQPMLDVDRELLKVPGGLNGLYITDREIVEEMQRIHVADWFISQHDTNSDSVMQLMDGSTASVDKGQAWKFFAHDYGRPAEQEAFMDGKGFWTYGQGTDFYHPTAGDKHLGSYIWDYAQGGGVVSREAVEPMLQRIESMTDEQLEGWLRNQAIAREEAGWGTADDFIAAMKVRRDSMRTAVNRAYAELGQVEIAKPGEMQSFRPGAYGTVDLGGPTRLNAMGMPSVPSIHFVDTPLPPEVVAAGNGITVRTIIVEGDGKLWAMDGDNGRWVPEAFADPYALSFGSDVVTGELVSTAIRAAESMTGLSVRIDAVLGDVLEGTGWVRYYQASRISGGPGYAEAGGRLDRILMGTRDQIVYDPIRMQNIKGKEGFDLLWEKEHPPEPLPDAVPVVEAPGAAPQSAQQPTGSRYTSYMVLENGSVFRSPWVDYPLPHADEVLMGNRAILSQKLDAVFRGWRANRILETQKGVLYRRLDSMSPSFGAVNVATFHAGLLELAREARYAGVQTVGLSTRWVEMPLMAKLSKEVEALAEHSFGKGPYLGRDGKEFTVDWGMEIAKSYRTSMKLNLTAGVTSQVKSMGTPGAGIGLVSDFVYPMWRFNLSPFFKGGEWVETPILNAMRGTSPFGMDDMAAATWQRAGLPTAGADLSVESLADMQLSGTGHGHNRVRSLRSVFFGSPPPKGYASEVAAQRALGPAPLTAAEQASSTSLRQRLFPMEERRSTLFADPMPQHRVEGLIPHKENPEVPGSFVADPEAQVALDQLRLSNYVDEQIHGLVSPIFVEGANIADEVEALAWGIGFADAAFTPDELLRLGLHHPIIHTTGDAMAGMRGVDELGRWMRDGIDPISGAPGRGHADIEGKKVMSGVTSAGVTSAARSRNSGARANTSPAEIMGGMADAMYAAAGFFDSGVAFMLKNEVMLPRSSIMNGDRIGFFRGGPTTALAEHGLGPNGAVSIAAAALRASTIKYAAEAAKSGHVGSTTLIDSLGYGRFSASSPFEHAFPEGGTWDDISAIFLDELDQRDAWADLVATYGDRIPALRDIRVIESRSIKEAWRLSFERAGLADKAGTTFDAGMIADETIPKIIPDEAITTASARTILAHLDDSMQKANYLHEETFSLEDVLRGEIARQDEEITRSMTDVLGKPTIEEGWPSSWDYPSMTPVEAAAKVREKALADLEVEKGKLADARVLLSDLEGWRASVGTDEADRIAGMATFIARARASGIRMSDTLEDYSPTGFSESKIIDQTTAEIVERFSLDPSALRSYRGRPYEWHPSGDTEATLARNLNEFVNRPAVRQRANPPVNTGWSAGDARDMADSIAPQSFLYELQRLAGDADLPQVKVWQRGSSDGLRDPYQPGDVVLTVSWPGGGQPLALADIEAAWIRTGLPEIQHAHAGGTIAPAVSDVFNVHRVAWTPEGGPSGSIMFASPNRLHSFPRGQMLENYQTGKWAFYPEPGVANSHTPRRITIQYAFDQGDAAAAWNMTDNLTVLSDRARLVTKVEEIPGVTARGNAWSANNSTLPEDLTGYRYLPATSSANHTWAYGWEDRGGFYDLYVSIAYNPSRARTEEAIRDAVATLRDKPIRLSVEHDTQLAALARMKTLNELPERFISEKTGHRFFPTDGLRRELVTEEELRHLTPYRTLPEAPPDSLEDVVGSVEHHVAEVEREWRQKIREAPAETKRRLTQGLSEFQNPVPYKQRQQNRLTRDITKDWYPGVLKRTMPDAYDLYSRELGVPDFDIVDYILEDRLLYERWISTNSSEDLRSLIAHADKYNIAKVPDPRAEIDALYESPDWQAVTELLHWTAKAGSDEAFGVHFFNLYRSTFERSINHPLLGVYPASWSYKVVKEWFRFLYKNETFGFNMGMQPAHMLQQWQSAQASAVARDDGVNLRDFYEDGPWSSSMFMMNLLMPGDWSNIPFPLSRSLRDMLRGNFNPTDHLQNNLFGMGLGRDVRLAVESGAEWVAAMSGDTSKRRRGEKWVGPTGDRR